MILINFEWFLGIFWLKFASNHAKIPILTPYFAFLLSKSTFSNKIMQFWSPTHTLNGISGLQNPIFSRFWRFLPVFSVRGVQKIFFDPKFFFFEKFDPKSIQNVLFRCHNSFWQITLYFVVKPQKSFSPIFQYKLASSRKVRSKTPRGQWCSHGKLCKSF